MLSFLFAHLARILAHGVAVRGKTFELEFNQTYPSFLGYDKRDLQRLQAGYARVGRTITPVPATCVANRLEKLILEKDWKEASGGLASFSSFQRLFGRLFSSGAAPACAPYLRQLS